MKKIKLICAGLLMLGTAKAQEIRSFTAIRSNSDQPDRSQLSKPPVVNKVQLSWTVLMEKSIQRFEIERSQDNEHYVKVRSIPQHFSSTELQQFSCTDVIANTGYGIYYYRLRIVNRPGAFKMSPAQVVRINRSLTPDVILADLVGDQ